MRLAQWWPGWRWAPVLDSLPLTRVFVAVVAWCVASLGLDGPVTFLPFIIALAGLAWWVFRGGPVRSWRLFRLIRAGIPPQHLRLALRVISTWAEVWQEGRIAKRSRQSVLAPWWLRAWDNRGGQDVDVVTIPKLLSMGPDGPHRFRILSSVPMGRDAGAFEKVAPTLADAWGVEIVRVSRYQPAVVALDVPLSDPLAETVPWSGQAGSASAVPFAVDEDGSLVSLRIAESNCLLGGVPGGGKSGGLSAILAGLASVPNVALIGLDPKLVELAEWSPRFSRIAESGDEATEVLVALSQEMERRYVGLRESKRKKWSAEEGPLLVLVVDELAELVAAGEDKKAETQRAVLLRRLVAKGRAAGICVIFATQKPSSDVVPTSLRDLVAQRVAYATTNADMTRVIVGDAEDALAHTIGHQPGVAYLVGEGTGSARRIRSLWVPDEDVARIAEANAMHRVALPWLTTEDSSDEGPDLRVVGE